MRVARELSSKVRICLQRGSRAGVRAALGCGLLVVLFYATNTSDPSTIHHVAIYIGNGMMVNAPHTGGFVRIDSMYAPGGLIGAVRPAG